MSSIFVVDDEPTIASALTTMLQLNGYSARFFTSPVEALAAARAERPGMLISDVALPQMSGIDLAVSMSRECPDMAILLFSGHANKCDVLEAARMRGYEFNLLSKPLHPAVVLSHICALTTAQVSHEG